VTPKQGCQMVCFQTKNPNLGKYWRVFAMKDVGIFYGCLVHFTVFSYILWTFGIVHGNLVYFSRFGIFTKKNLATLLKSRVTRWVIAQNEANYIFVKSIS
jgi:hypothetical protein